MTSDTPTKLNIQCLLSILTVEDKTTLGDKIWEERKKSLWLAEVDGDPEDFYPASKTLVKAGDYREAICKLVNAQFWDFTGVRLFDRKHKNYFEGEFPTFTKDMTAEKYVSILRRITHDKNGKRIYTLQMPDDYSLTRLSCIKFIT